MKIAIVGLGWLGFPLAKSLQAKGHEVVGSTRTPSKIEAFNAAGIQSVVLNDSLENSQELTRFFENTAICILNFPPNRRENPDNLKAYGQQAVRIAALFPSNCKFIFVSSTGIYPDENQITEETSFDRDANAENNHLAYAESILDQLLGKRLTIVRMAGLIGENRNLAIYFSGRENLPNGNAPVNLIHQTDCIRMLEQIIAKNCWGETFNACASEHPSRAEYYTFACEKAGIPLPSFLNDARWQGKEISNEKSKSVLKFTYQFDSPYLM